MNSNDENKKYLKLKNNSIGSNKRSNGKRRIIFGDLKKSTKLMYTVFKFACITSCSIISEPMDKVSAFTDSKGEYNGYSYSDIAHFETNRVYELMDNYELDEYSLEDGKRVYNYDSKVYKKIPQIDDSYLYGFYLISDTNTMNQISISFGYKDFEDYIHSNGFKSEEEWIENSLNDISIIMQNKKGTTK